MKKIIATLFLIIMISYSCGKDGSGIFTACYTCTVTTVTSSSPSMQGLPQTVKTVLEKCDMTSSDARKVESAETVTATSSTGGYTVTVRATCNCVKK